MGRGGWREWYSVRGRLTDSGARLESQGETGAWTPMDLTWIPTQGTFTGFTAVTLEAMRRASDGALPLRGQPCG